MQLEDIASTATRLQLLRNIQAPSDHAFDYVVGLAKHSEAYSPAAPSDEFAEYVSLAYSNLLSAIDARREPNALAPTAFLAHKLLCMTHLKECDSMSEDEIYENLGAFLGNPGKGARVGILCALYSHSRSRGAIDDSVQNREALRLACLVVEGLHNLSLIVDDAIDGDLVRRGHPTLYCSVGTVGVSRAAHILTGAIEHSIVSSKICAYERQHVIDAVLSASRRIAMSIHEETRWDMAETPPDWKPLTPLLERILLIYLNKTAALMHLGIEILEGLLRLPQHITTIFKKYVLDLGILLQRANDIENYLTTKDDRQNVDRFCDIAKRRATLLLCRREFCNSRLTTLRDTAFASNRSRDLIETFGLEVVASGILDAEANEICATLDNRIRELQQDHLLAADECNQLIGILISYMQPLIRAKLQGGLR